MSRAPSKTVSMSVVTIGFQHVLLPTNKAIAVLEVLQHAVMVEQDYDRDHVDGFVYIPKEETRVEMKLVKPSQIVGQKPTRGPKPGQTLLLEG